MQLTGVPSPARLSERFEVKAKYPGPIPADYTPFPRAALHSSVAAQFDLAVTRHADRIAVVEAGRTLTYAALDGEANAYAHALLAALGEGEEPVAVIMDLDDPVLPALIGVLKAGKIYAALNPAESPVRVQQLLARLDARAMITAARYLPALQGVLAPGQTLLVADELMTLPHRESPGLALAPERGAAIFFTSGSTGLPKGVLRDHGNFLHVVQQTTELCYFAPSDRHALTTFPGFSSSLYASLPLLLTGGSVVPIAPRTLSASSLLAYLHTQAITVTAFNVALLREVMAAADVGPDLPHLRLVTTSGQSLYAQDVAEFQRTLGKQAALLYSFGLSEVGRVSAAFMDATTPIPDARVPAGYLLPEFDVLILDEQGQPLGAEQVGEIVIRSRDLARGYWRDEEQTNTRYHPDPELAGMRRYHTGDLGLLRADGCLEHHGRRDSMVKIRGYQVELGEVERTLQAHPGIALAVAVAHLPADRQAVLAAYVTMRDAPGPTTDELRRYMAARLPAHMVPARFIVLAEMPMTATGKPARRNLPPPGNRRPDLATAYAPPETPLHAELAELWAGILELDGVGVDDDFVELGGNSLQLARVLTWVEQTQGHVVALPAWIGTPTIRHLARLIAGNSQPETNAPTPIGANPAPPRLPPLKRMLARLTGHGPIVRGVKLPYTLGIPLQRAWIRIPWVRREMLGRAIGLFEHWRDSTGLDDADGRCLEQFLLNNTWELWRQAHLMQPEIRRRWVKEEGAAAMVEAAQAGRGVVFVTLHMGPQAEYLRALLRHCHFAELFRIAAPPAYADANVELAARVALIRQGGEVLGRGGAVLIAGDGNTGTDGALRPFFGHTIRFMRGPAYLAVEHGAPLIPLFHHVRIGGDVTVEYLPPLYPAQTGAHEDRVDDLNRRYVEALTAHWPQVLPSMRWPQLQRWIDQSNAR